MWRPQALTTDPDRFNFRVLCALIALHTVGATPARAEIAIDGRLDEAEWREAQRCSGWRRTAPFVRDEPRYGNDVAFVSTADGLAAAFTIDQPGSVRRVRPRTPRDSGSLGGGDSVVLVIDFDADAQAGYEFAVALGGGVRDGRVTNQNQFDYDWDGEWRHAIQETDERWTVEIFIPWSTVSMRDAVEHTRTIGVYAARYLSARDERYACPGILTDAAVFLSELERLSIPHFKATSELAVIPYATAMHDLLADESQLKAGADITWKTPNFWLSAALNPDFGQVESDELVVNFSAIETVFTDKRPFFTENQELFELRTPANGQLIYTRRIGAVSDDGGAGSSDIDAALKLAGDAGALDYGVFVVQEDDYAQDVGRRFGAARLAAPHERWRLGYLTTWTERPYVEREAWINAVDFEATPGEWWRMAGQLVRSDVRDGSLDVDEDGYEAWLQADLNRSGAVRHTLRALHIDDRFDLNDLGYMERNSLEQIEWDINRYVTPAQDSRVNGETQRLYMYYRQNADGERLPSRVQVVRDVRYRSAWRSYLDLRYITSGVDDLLSRGNGPVRLDERLGAYFDFQTPRLGAWQVTMGAYAFQDGVEDYSGRLEFLLNWYPTDKLTFRFDVLPYVMGDWLLWETGNLFGSYEAERLDVDLRVDWIPDPRHELRIKWQWIGVDADVRQAYRTDAAGRLYPVADPIAPFTLSNLGLQIRYRYAFAPQSELYVVYGRGGFDVLSDDDRGVGQLFRDMSDVRDADQFLIKIRYRL